MKVSITPKLIQEGVYAGTACLYVDLLDENGKEMELNEILNILLNTKMRNVVFHARPSETSDVCTMVKGLAAKNRIPTLETYGNEKIDSFRIIRGARMFVRCGIPEGQTGGIEFSNFALFKEEDQVLFEVSSKEQYAKAVEFLTSRTITRPTILFSLQNLTPEQELEVTTQFLKDQSRFNFRARITKPVILA